MNSNYINVEWKIEKYVHICTLYMQLLSPSPHPRNYTSNLRLKFWWSLKSITWFWLWGTVWIDRTKKKKLYVCKVAKRISFFSMRIRKSNIVIGNFMHHLVSLIWEIPFSKMFMQFYLKTYTIEGFIRPKDFISIFFSKVFKWIF
jgi:hypothetical protein